MSTKTRKRRKKRKNLRIQKTGLPPGSLIYTGEKTGVDVSIHIINYTEADFTEKTYRADENYLAGLPDDPSVKSWLNVNGIHDVAVIEKIGARFKLHPLILEDILNVYQLPKVDEYPDAEVLYITLDEFYNDEQSRLSKDQISIVVGRNFVLTFQEEEGDYFNIIRDRLRNAKGRIRKSDPDYLAYALLDAVVDSYYIIIDKFSTEIETLEIEIFENKNKDHLENIHQINRDLIGVRRSINPLKEVIYQLLKEDILLIGPSSRLFLKDLLDHTNQVVNQIETNREYLSDLVQTNMANLNGRLNQVIKVLTVISTIFIPLTFIVGVYGMNFENFPELHWYYGYFIIWGVMILIVAVQLIIFRRNKWI